MNTTHIMGNSYIALWVAFFVYLSHTVLAEEYSFPLSFRSEGRIALQYEHDGKPVVHTLAFTETVDSDLGRSVLSIGYTSYKPAVYYTRKNAPIITLGQDNQCRALDNGSPIVPELSWVLPLMLPQDIDLKSLAPRFMIGPTALFGIFHALQTDRMTEGSEPIIYRNIPCTRHWRSFPVSSKTEMDKVKLEMLIPQTQFAFSNSRQTFFTITIASFDGASGTEHGRDQLGKLKARFTIDYYNIEPLDQLPAKTRFENMRDDFNVPLARGCSSLLDQITPEISAESFSMSYRQTSINKQVYVAYDHANKLMRREIARESANIWDLNEDLLYLISLASASPAQPVSTKSTDTELVQRKNCAVLSVLDQMLSSTFKPYKNTGEALSLVQMIGAERVAYMGKSLVRDMPCRVFEATVESPPALFALPKSELNRPFNSKPEYVVHYHVLESSRTQIDETITLNQKAFWPARIALWRRLPATGAVELIDQLDVFDFTWTLDGWAMKPSELFMPTKCYDDEDQLLRIEFAAEFERVHNGAAKQDDKSLLMRNKYQLETFMLDDVMSKLSVSKSHIVEYTFSMRPHEINVNMVIGDKSEVRILSYFGEGWLPTPNSYEQNRLIFDAASEESCVMEASLVNDVSLAMYCPPQGKSVKAQCIVVYNEAEPSIKTALPPSRDSPESTVEAPQIPCQAYSFVAGEAPKKNTEPVEWKQFVLGGHAMTYAANDPRIPSQPVQFNGVIRFFTMTHEVRLTTVEHYRYVMPKSQAYDTEQTSLTTVASSEPPKVREFPELNYASDVDCARICDLDVHCKSYSFCKNTRSTQSKWVYDDNEPRNECILSRLDVRTSKLSEQLLHLDSTKVSKTSGANQLGTIEVEDERGLSYDLEFANQCNIYERNYLDAFRATDESLRIGLSLATQFQFAKSAFECAKRAVDLELSAPNHHVAMFAFCSNDVTACILDENIISKPDAEQVDDADAKSSSTANDDGYDASKQPREAICRIYRKKYHTYFDVSAEIVVSKSQDQQLQAPQQTALTFGSVEECARACWTKFGQVCASFDYCAPSRQCLINQMSARENSPTALPLASNMRLEARAGCLHYERNLELDELHRKHLIGRHELLTITNTQSIGSFFSKVFKFIVTLLGFALVAASFAGGLIVGRQVNDHLDNVTILRAASVSAASPARANGANLRVSGSESSFANSVYGTDAIRLSEITHDHDDNKSED